MTVFEFRRAVGFRLGGKGCKHVKARKFSACCCIGRHNALGCQNPEPVTSSLTEEFLKLRVSVLKARLAAVGVDCEGILDKETLVAHLVEHHVHAQSKVVAMKLRKLPQRTRGSESSKSHLAVPVDIDGIGFYDFLIDSGSSGILITAELRSELGISPTSGRFMNGLDCNGHTVRQKIELPCLRLGPMELQLREAVVTKLELSHEIGGVLGLSFLRQVEMVVDVEKGVIEFHPVGHAEQGFISIEGMTRLDLSVGKGGLAVVPASLNGSPFIPAIIDISATTSIINAAAATFADIAQRPPTPPLSTSRMMRCHITHNVDFDPFLDVSLGSPTEPEGENNLGADEEASSSSSPGCEAEGRTNAVGAACFGQFNTRIPQPIPVRELPGLESMGLSNLPLMILGMDLMCGSSRAVFCFGSNALYIRDKI